jgi:hypothetical protein
MAGGCKEEYIGQYPVDGTPPAPVSNVRVQNLEGKAVITYSLPEEDDLLCIKAVYISPNGSRKEMSSSAYSNSIELKGFGKSAKTKVELYAVDKSYNESAPITVEIEPLDSPVYDVIKTLVLYEAFGGLKLYWENPLGEDIVMGALAKEDGEYRPIEIIYSSERIADKAIRGLESRLTDFAFYFRDMFNNYTDTLYVQMTPIFEEEIDKSKFVALRLSSKFAFHSYGGASIARMWDNVYNVDDNLCYINVAPEKIYFAFDMGVEAKLSRFRLWTRRNYMYQLHHIRTFEIWGTSDQSATTDPDNWDGWVKIMDCESFRPSGLTEGGNPTAEETQYLLAGEEFEVPVEAPKFRYMKFKINSTWSNSAAAFINEISIWGSTK